MNMMLVGGKRSREYAEHIQNQFSIATRVLAGFSLDEIDRMAVLGNIIERILILEQAWTIDGASTNERDMRKRLGEMTKQARERGGTEQYVFMARSPESAQLCFEETYDICDRAAIVLYQQSATVVILHELLATDIVGLRPIFIYNPPLTEVEDPFTVTIDVAPDVAEVTATTTVVKRVIKKTRGASIQREAGNTPWYAPKNIGGTNMYEQSLNVGKKAEDLFGKSTELPSDKGFADDSKYIPAASIDLNPKLQHIFKNGGDPFAPQTIPPVAVIPVASVAPETGNVAAFIRSKAHRGYILAFISPGGSGSTFIALNCAARIYAAGFSTCFIDGDISGHSAQYLTRLGIAGDVFSAEFETRTLRPGFDMYGVGQFTAEAEKGWNIPENIKERYDFIVLDLSFTSLKPAIQAFLSSSRIAVTVESSNWGIGKAALALFNTPIDILSVIKERGRLIYNRSDKLSSGLFGSAVGDDAAIKNRVEEVFGARGTAFSSVQAASIVGSYSSAEDFWFSDKLFSDTTDGAALFDNILLSILA